jgi:rhodanese-related sulfurtransferase
MNFFRKRLRQPACAVLILFWLAIFVSGCKSMPDAKYSVAHPRLSLAQFQAYVESRKVPILDARDPQSYTAGHVPGAINFPPGDFANEYEALVKFLGPHQKNLVIVYCDDQWCGRADELQSKLIARGHRHVACFPGGWSAWREAKLPMEHGKFGAAGMQLKAAADAVGKPIYLEMSSLNPVVILPGALAERGVKIVEEFTGNCLMASGQFCTSPGLIILFAGNEAEQFIAGVKTKLESTPPGTLISSGVACNLNASVKALQSAGAELITGGSPLAGNKFANTLLRVSGEKFLPSPEKLQTEAFGNASLVAPTSGSDGKYFWIHQWLPPEKTFPDGFEYVLMGRVAGVAGLELETVQGQTSLGTPGVSEEINNAPGAAVTAKFTSRKKDKLLAYVTVVTTIDADGGDVMALSRASRRRRDGWLRRHCGGERAMVRRTLRTARKRAHFHRRDRALPDVIRLLPSSFSAKTRRCSNLVYLDRQNQKWRLKKKSRN